MVTDGHRRQHTVWVLLPPVILFGNVDIHLIVHVLLGRLAGAAGPELVRIGESTRQKAAGLVVGLALEELIVTVRELVILTVVDKNLGVVDDEHIVRVLFWYKDHVKNGDRNSDQETVRHLLV